MGEDEGVSTGIWVPFYCNGKVPGCLLSPHLRCCLGCQLEQPHGLSRASSGSQKIQCEGGLLILTGPSMPVALLLAVRRVQVCVC